MSYLKPNLSGVYDIPSLNASSQLYIRGKKFEDYINELVFEDQLEQDEINEIKLLLQYLNTSGLNSEWIVDNNNKNQDLKTAITALQTKLANVTTTSLTQNSNLTDDNRNSVLKTRTDTLDASMNALTGRVDGNDSSIGTLNGKTQYITASVGDNNVNPKTYSQHAVVVSNAAQRKRILLSPYPALQGAFNINLTNDESEGHQVNTDAWALINRIDIKNLYGNMEIEARKIHMQGKVEIGDFGDATTDRRPINIGGSMARINIGSEITPKTGTGPGDPDTNDSTIIKIGKLGNLKNTWTYLNGNIYTTDARFENLSATDVITWQVAASWAAGFVFSGVPYFLAWIGLSGVPNYRYSDVVKMANNYLTGGLTKNKAIETSNDLALSKLTIIDTSVVSLTTAFDALLNRLCFQAFTIHGSHSIGSIIGKTNIYAGSGEVELRVDGGVFDWALKNAGNSNRVLLTNTDVEVVQCNGTGGSGRLKLVAGNGNIDLETAPNGVRGNTTKVMEIKSNKQIVIGSNSAMVDDTYKVIVDATTHTNGIKVAKNSDALLLNPTNVSSKSLTLQSGYGGTTTNALYLNEGGQLMFNGSVVGSGTGGDGAGGGLIYILSGPTTDLTYTAANLVGGSYDMVTTYVSRPATKFRLSTYTAGTHYNLFKHRAVIPNISGNPILKGAYEYSPYITYSATGSGATGQFYVNMFFYADGLVGSNLINKTYAVGNQAGTGFQSVGSNCVTAPIQANNNTFTLDIRQVVFPAVNIFGANLIFRCEILDLDNAIVFYTFPTITLTSQSGGTITSQSELTFDAGGLVALNQGFIWIGTRFRFRLSLISGSSGGFFSQPSAGNTSNMAYRIPNFTGVGFTTPLSINVGNRTLLPSLNNPIQTLYSSILPVTDYDISAFSNPYLDLHFYFIQPSGATNGHTIDVHFGDGALAHIHTSLNAATGAAIVPSLSSVLTSGNSAGSTQLNMNNNGIINVPYGGLVGTDTLAWNVRNITAGTGITASNSGNGTITIAATATGPIKVNLAFNQTFTANVTTNNVNFNMPTSYNLLSYRLSGKIVLSVDANFDYPAIRFNGSGTIGDSSAQLNEQTWSKIYEYPSASNNGMASLTLDGYLSRDPIFAHMQNNANTQILLSFDINLMNIVNTSATREPIMVCKGTASYGAKNVGGSPTYRAVTFFERWSNQTSISQISINNWTTSGASISYATLDLDVIPIPGFSSV